MCNISSSSFLKLPDNTDVATLLVVWSTGGAGRTTGKPAICRTWHRSPGSWCYRGWTSADRTPPLLSTSGLLQNWCCKVKKWPVNITPWFWSITMFIKADKLNISSLDQNIMHFSWSKDEIHANVSVEVWTIKLFFRYSPEHLPGNIVLF